MYSFKDLQSVDYTATGDEQLARKAKYRRHDDVEEEMVKRGATLRKLVAKHVPSVAEATLDESRPYVTVSGQRHREDDEGHGSGHSRFREVHKVYINGRPWKTFDNHADAHRAHQSVQKKYPDKHVSTHKTYTEGVMNVIARVKRGMEAKAKASDHWDKAMDAHGKDDEASKKHLRKAVRYSNVGVKEEVEIDESAAAGLAAKADKSGVSLSVLKKVYARGVAAWNSGHRPGTTPQQWGMARVNSYITKGKGTYHGADKDLREESVDEAVAKDKESGLAKKYVSGLSTSTAKSRAAHWNKMDKLSDRDPRAYEPAPGDATAETKPSKHTKKYHAMYGESVDQIDEAVGQGGRDYEVTVNDKLKKHGKAKQEWGTAGSSADAPDAKFIHNDQEHNVEIKADHKAMFGQMELKHDGNSWDFSERSKKKYPETHKAISKTGFLDKINKTWKKPTGDYDKDLKMGNVYHTHSDASPIKAHYGKDRKTDYIQIGAGHGFYHTGKDAAGLGSPELHGETQLRARMKYRGTDKKTGKKQYGALVVMSLKNAAKSHHDLDAEVKESFDIQNTLEIINENLTAKFISEAQGPCWDNYKMQGMKIGKKGRTVPNCVPEENSGDVKEAVLSPSQRLKRAQVIRRNQTRIKLGRKIAGRRLATQAVLQRRAKARARKMVLRKMLKNRSKSDLSYSARAGYEKMLATRKGGIARLSKRILPQVRRADVSKFQK